MRYISPCVGVREKNSLGQQGDYVLMREISCLIMCTAEKPLVLKGQGCTNAIPMYGDYAVPL